MVKNQIRCREIDIPLGARDHLEIDRLPNQLSVGRKVCVRLNNAVFDARRVGFCGQIQLIIRSRTRVGIPDRKKLYGNTPRRITRQPHRSILPMPVLFADIDILIRQIDAADKRDIPVNDGDLAVVAVVGTRRENGVERIEDVRFDASLTQGALIGDRQGQHGTEIVVHDAHLNTGCCTFG